jgi:hypothetical protein
LNVDILIKEIALALEVPEHQISIDSDSSSIEVWDSLGHISILARLDLVFENVTERIPDLASAMSVKEIHKLMNSAGL